MTQINIQEQKDWLKSQLTVEFLTSDPANESLIQSFSANKQGKGLELFLKSRAWQEDIDGSTRVYLVKEKSSGVIVFFFALKAGLLYKAIEDDDYILTEKERDIVNLCIEYSLDPSNSLAPDDVFEWYSDDPLDKDKLRKIIEEKVDIKLQAKQDQQVTNETVNIMRVSKTFPGIVLTHFCKNQNSSLPYSLLFPLGFYVFWEIITDKVLQISKYLGCQYLYLFAADNTAHTEESESFLDFLYADVSDDFSEEKSSYKLIEYYKNELKFEDVQNMTILKPHYDFECYSLVQPINKLLKNKEAAWIQHSDIEE